MRCVVDHSIFIRTSSSGYVFLVVYVDDILVTGSDTTGISETKQYQSQHFVTKDIGIPKYFLDIKFAYAKDKMVLLIRVLVFKIVRERCLRMLVGTND